MSVELASGYISLFASAKDIGASISREMSAPVESAAKQSGDKVAGIFGKVAGVVGGAFALRAGVNLFKGFIDQAEESRKVGAQSAAVIASTGGAANITAKQMSSLATAISKKTGIDDEAIQSGENLLATFTNVRNEAGRGNDVFNQSTKVLTDMAASLGGDASSNAIQLGKALNDPVQGISALTRVGVTFTQQQKAQIGSMVKVGDVAGAQKVILAELSKEFGGSAEAQATAGKKMSVAWGNLQETIGGALLPVMDRLSTIFAGVINFVQANALPVLAAAIPIAIGITAAIAGWAAATIAATIAEYAFLGPIILVTLAVAAVAAGVIYAYQHFAFFRTAVDALGQVFQAVFGWISDHWPLLLAILTGPFGIAVLLIVDHFDGIKDAVTTAVRFIVDKFLGMAVWIVNAADTAFGWIPKLGDPLDKAKKAIEGFRDDVNAALGGIQKEVEVTVHAKLSAGQTGSLVYGVRADGGPVSAGRPYLVGEQGPEIFTPRVPGSILTNDVTRQLRDTSIAPQALNVNATLNATFTGKPDRESEKLIERCIEDFASQLCRTIAAGSSI